MIDVDGSEGGGQLVRLAIACSMLRGEPIRIADIRASRPTPGLRPQHLTAVELAASLCDAAVEGARVGASTVTFEPDVVEAGDRWMDVGSAGSISLVFDTVLPLALSIDRPMSVTATGGTDVKWAPPMDYFRAVKIPLLADFGVHAAVDVQRRGYYPVGDGKATLRLFPSRPERLELERRGEIESLQVMSVCSWELRDRDVANRQAGAVERVLSEGTTLSRTTPENSDDEDRDTCPIDEISATAARSRSPGSSVVLSVTCEGGAAGFDALGERGKPAEDVGTEAANALQTFLDTAGAVDRHLADQLLLFLAVAGGKMAVPEITDHVTTSIGLLRQFDYDLTVKETADGRTIISKER